MRVLKKGEGAYWMHSIGWRESGIRSAGIWEEGFLNLVAQGKERVRAGLILTFEEKGKK